MGYTVNDKTYDYFSVENQSILDKLVNREVYCCMTSEVEYMLRKSAEGDDDNPFCDDDYFSTYTRECSKCGGSCGFTQHGKDGITTYECNECGAVLTQEEYDELDYTPEEIYEWWAVSTWYGEKLKEVGCIVIDSYGKSYWGRSTTGQAISLDWCTAKIAEGMGILEGMEHDWSDRK